jgi:hypothetical protein
MTLFQFLYSLDDSHTQNMNENNRKVFKEYNSIEMQRDWLRI